MTDDDEFRQVAERLRPHLDAAYRVALEKMVDPKTADDVVQAAAGTVWRRRQELPDESEFGSWFLEMVEKEFWLYRPRPTKDRRDTTFCSFCGKGQDQVRKLIAGPAVYICDQCVDLCVEVLEGDARRKPPNGPGGP